MIESKILRVFCFFLLLSCGKEENDSNTVRDIDGNTYHTISIGTQIWMVENLRTTKFNDGSSIPNITINSEWVSTKGPALCWYNYGLVSKRNDFGALYNWYAVNTGKLCPPGWHVPSDAEWSVLEEYLGGNEIAGGKMKEKETGQWQSPNTGATNESGFSALPGGCRFEGEFWDLGLYGNCWSSTETDSLHGWNWYTGYNTGSLMKFNAGFSVRCIKDN